MRGDHASVNPSDADAPHERRRHARFTPQNVHSLLGEVLDLSATGMRVLHQGPPLVEIDEEFDILLQDGEHDLLLPVRVVRIDPKGARRQAIGLEVTDHSPEVQQLLLAMHPEAKQEQSVGTRAYRMG